MALEVFYHHRNIFSTWGEAYVIPVNCVGVPGAGLAKQFADDFPKWIVDRYKKACEEGDIAPGRVFCMETNLLVPEYLIFFPTKRHWRDESRYVDIRDGLNDMVRVIEQFNLKTISMPKIGCGLGGLDWKSVHWLIIDGLQYTDVRLVLAIGEERKV